MKPQFSSSSRTVLNAPLSVRPVEARISFLVSPIPFVEGGDDFYVRTGILEQSLIEVAELILQFSVGGKEKRVDVLREALGPIHHRHVVRYAAHYHIAFGDLFSGI